jgi:translation initiation factor 2 subunit 1
MQQEGNRENALNIPKIGELVIVQVSKVMQFGAYCRLPEYSNTEVFLPIKEVSSGWIKNIREFIHEGQSIVCKVVLYDKERHSIDVSLKKVTPKETKDKIGKYNLEKRLTALVQQSIKASGVKGAEEEMERIRVENRGYSELFQHAISEDAWFENLKIPDKLKEEIKKIIKANMKEKKKVVSYIVTMVVYNTESGASKLRTILDEGHKSGVEISYISAPKYRFSAEGKDYIEAENKIKKAMSIAEAKLSKEGIFKFEKEKLKREKDDILAQI